MFKNYKVIKKNRDLRSKLLVTSRNAGSINQLVPFKKMQAVNKEYVKACEDKNITKPEAKKLLQPSENEYPSIFNYPYERAIYWFENDLLLKVKSDILRYPLENAYAENKIILVDYKTTQSCEPSSFLSSVKRYKYDLQAAWYRRGFEKAGFEVLDFYFVAQEKKHPYASKIFKMKKEDMDKGWEVLEKNLQDYAKVLDGERPTVYNTPDIVELSLSDEE